MKEYLAVYRVKTDDGFGYGNLHSATRSDKITVDDIKSIKEEVIKTTKEEDDINVISVVILNIISLPVSLTQKPE